MARGGVIDHVESAAHDDRHVTEFESSVRSVLQMGGDAPQNRKQEYKKQQKREGGGGGGEGRSREADGKPLRVKGIGTYQKPEPGFVATMMAAYAAKNQANPATKQMDGGIDAMMGNIDAKRAGREPREQVVA